MGVIIINPRSVVRRGMKRTIEDLGNHVSNPQVHDICEKHVDDWSSEEESVVQAQIDSFKAQ